MDDLLALMEDESPGEISNSACSGVVNTRTVTPASNQVKPYKRRDVSVFVDAAPHQQQQQLPTMIEPENKLALSVDDKLGIRMINRKISGADLMDHICSNPFHSTASLSAMSLTALNRLLADPAAVIDAATVCGRTNLLTVGIVFTSSGTRVGSTGNAFCALTIGNLNTGPAVSVLMFGGAYSKFCRLAAPGKVIALVNPRLIPPKPDSSRETSVSFSVSDERQLLLVADARDYGICKATIRGKNDQGQWVDNAKKCRSFIDKRVCEYCTVHRKMKNVKVDPVKGTRTMQQLRSDAVAFPTARGATLTLPVRHVSIAPDLQQRAAVAGRSFTPSQLQTRSVGEALQTSVLSQKGFMSTNTILNPQSSNGAAPDRMNHGLQSNSMLSQGSVAWQQVQARGSCNPYQKKTLPTKFPFRSTPSDRTDSRGNPVPKKCDDNKSRRIKSDWLDESIKNGSRSTPSLANKKAPNRKRAVNTSFLGGFDGSVPVPKPSRVFAASRASEGMPSSRHIDPRFLAHSGSSDVKIKEDILTKQREMAQRLCDPANSNINSTDKLSHRTASDSASRPLQTSKASARPRNSSAFADMVGDIDAESVLHAKSKFGDEVAAEEYALSRSRMVELEKEEETKSKKLSKSKAEAENAPSGIKKEWVCKKCARSFKKQPVACYRLGHPVKIMRVIEEEKSTSESRLIQSEKNPEDGGLKLGSGLEWSRWRFS